MPSTPKVLVSLVTHNESRDVEKLLPTLFAQTFRDVSVVATDNASEDGTRSALASFEKVTPFPLSVIPSRVNLGFTGGHNVAIQRAADAGIPWVLVLNADVILDPAFLERLLEEAERPAHARVGSFTGKISRAQGEALDRTSTIDTVGLWMTRGGRHFDVGSGEEDRGQFDRPAEIFGVSGCVALYRTEALQDVKIRTGYYDDDFFLYREDVDLAWRLRGRGWTSRYAPGALAWHRRRNLPERRRSMSALANLHSVKNRFLLRINNAGKDHIRATFPETFGRDLVVVGGCLTVERSSWDALAWLARSRDHLLEKREEIQSRRTVSDRELLRWFVSDPRGARVDG